MFNILSGKCKSGKSSLALYLAKRYANVLYYTDQDPKDIQEELENYSTVKTSFSLDDLEKDIKDATHIINSPASSWHGTIVEVKLVVIDCVYSSSSTVKEYIAEIATRTQTKIILCENISNF